MCDLITRVAHDPAIPESSRRSFLKVMGGALAMGGAAGVGLAPAGAAESSAAHRTGGRKARSRLVLLGTAGGPGILQGGRSGISTAVAYQDRVYLFDLGLGALLQLRRSSLAGEVGVASSLSRVRGIFFTHMHSDHLMDWPATYATGPINTRSGAATATPIEVFGPGDRQTLPRVFPPTRPAPALYNPEQPTPGIVGMTDYLTQAWSADFNDRARDSNFAGPQSTFRVHDIDLSSVWTPDPLGKPPRLAAPIHVWSEDEVHVTATLVDHHPTAPAFAYRIDTPDGSVTISGDTTVSQNLIDLAQGTDYLVHEVIDPQWVAALVATLPPEVGGPLGTHLLESHTTIEQVGRDVAEPAGAKNLVLTHLLPENNSMGRWRQAARGYSGRLIVGEDLMELPIG
jgi:ribonuclease BN (tRNA processing enzyme)